MNGQIKRLYEFDEFSIDPEDRLLLRKGQVVALPPKAFVILLVLVGRNGQVVTKDDFLKALCPDDVNIEESNITVYMSMLRKALSEGSEGRPYINTIRGQGYRFAPIVKEVWIERDNTSLEQQAQSVVIADKDVAPDGLQWLSHQHIQAESAEGIPTAGPVDNTTGSESTTLSARYYQLIIAAILFISVAAVFAYILKSRPQPMPPPSLSNRHKITNDSRTKTGPLITDGPRVYFLEVVDGNHIPFQVLNIGGEINAINVPFSNTVLLDISPDQTQLLIGSQATIETEMQLWVMPLLGSSPRPVGDLRAHAGAWSPDGKDIVYANGSKLSRADTDGTEHGELVDIPSGLPYNLRWSPNGSLLRFQVQNPQTRLTSLWEVNANGTDLHPLLPNWNKTTAECCGNWTADGKYFVFQATHNQTAGIWAIRERTPTSRDTDYQPIQLTEGITYRSPVMSKDGKRLFAISELRHGELLRHDRRTQQWIRYLPGISADNLDVSRDGKWIVYVTYPEGELWKSKADGSERRQLSFPPLRVHNPRWSPDGRRICFTAKGPGLSWKIYLISAEGGNAEPLTQENENEFGPGWSPDGNTLVFWKGERLLGKTAIYLLNLKTKTASELPGSSGFFSPRWSPKGNYIAAVPSKDGTSLLLYQVNRGLWKILVNANVTYPSWSRDGEYIYFESFNQSDPAVFRVTIHDSKCERWATLKDIQRASGAFGPWMGLAPDGSVLVLHDTGIQNIYAFDFQAP